MSPLGEGGGLTKLFRKDSMLIDFAWARPPISLLQSLGVTAVLRYVGPPSWGKTITQGEWDAYVNNGIAVGLVFEQGADDAAGGFSAGVSNANLAVAYAPAGWRFIYMAEDSDVAPGDSVRTAYFQGAASVLSPQRHGIYGPGGFALQLFNAGIVTKIWQSASTSYNGNSHPLPQSHIQQGVGAPVPGYDTDPNTSLQLDFGQYPSPGSAPTPIPIQQKGSVFMIPTGCTDNGAVCAQMREWWATYRSDPMPAGAPPFFSYFWTLPQNQTAWGKPGWGSNPDLALAWLIDDASTTSHLRPQYIGAV